MLYSQKNKKIYPKAVTESIDSKLKQKIQQRFNRTLTETEAYSFWVHYISFI